MDFYFGLHFYDVDPDCLTKILVSIPWDFRSNFNFHGNVTIRSLLEVQKPILVINEQTSPNLDYDLTLSGRKRQYLSQISVQSSAMPQLSPSLSTHVSVMKYTKLAQPLLCTAPFNADCCCSIKVQWEPKYHKFYQMSPLVCVNQ